MKPVISTLFLLSLCYSLSVAQQSQEEEIPAFNPSVSSIMLHPGQMEFNLFSGYSFNNVQKEYPQSIAISKEDIAVLPVRSDNTFFVGTFQGTIGITNGISMGFDANYTRQNNDFILDTTKHNFEQDVIRLGPRLRWSLYSASKSNLVVQHYFQFPINNVNSFSNVLNEFNFGNQIIWTIRLKHFILMNQLDVIVYDKKEFDSKIPIIVPYTFYSSYLINTETMIFGLIQYVAEFGNVPYATDPERYYKRAYSLNMGLGLQRRIFRNLGINIYYSHALKSDNYLGYHSINFGLRYATR